MNYVILILGLASYFATYKVCKKLTAMCPPNTDTGEESLLAVEGYPAKVKKRQRTAIFVVCAGFCFVIGLALAVVGSVLFDPMNTQETRPIAFIILLFFCVPHLIIVLFTSPWLFESKKVEVCDTKPSQIATL